MKRAFLVRVLLCLWGCAWAARPDPARADWRLLHDFETGAQGSLRLDDGEANRRRLYLAGAIKLLHESDDSDARLDLDLAARMWLDIENQFDPRAASLSWSKGIFSTTVGFQQVAWGETFGVFIADLVNPRDYRDPLFNELDWIRLPVAAINMQCFPGAWRIQSLFTPFPRADRLPAHWRGTRILPPEPRAEGSTAGSFDPEWGLRAGRLFGSGLDLSAFFFSHHNRGPAFVGGLDDAGDPYLRPVRNRVLTLGVGASFATEIWTFRGDSVVHLDQPIQPDVTTPPVLQTLSRTVLGADARLTDALDLGLQYHLDVWPAQTRHWISARVAWRLLGDRLVPEIFVFGGLDNGDLWIQPRITWLATDHLTLSLRGDFVARTSSRLDPGLLNFLVDEDRVLAWVSYRL